MSGMNDARKDVHKQQKASNLEEPFVTLHVTLQYNYKYLRLNSHTEQQSWLTRTTFGLGV